MLQLLSPIHGNVNTTKNKFFKTLYRCKVIYTYIFHCVINIKKVENRVIVHVGGKIVIY